MLGEILYLNKIINLDIMIIIEMLEDEDNFKIIINKIYFDEYEFINFYNY